MEYSKEQVLSMKGQIKTLAVEQRSLKSQRKTIHFKGQRSVDASQAAFNHRINRYDLRHLHIAYGIMRGKSVEQIETKSKTPFDQKKVDKILETYGQAVYSNA